MFRAGRPCHERKLLDSVTQTPRLSGSSLSKVTQASLMRLKALLNVTSHDRLLAAPAASTLCMVVE